MLFFHCNYVQDDEGAGGERRTLKIHGVQIDLDATSDEDENKIESELDPSEWMVVSNETCPFSEEEQPQDCINWYKGRVMALENQITQLSNVIRQPNARLEKTKKKPPFVSTSDMFEDDHEVTTHDDGLETILETDEEYEEDISYVKDVRRRVDSPNMSAYSDLDDSFIVPAGSDSDSDNEENEEDEEVIHVNDKEAHDNMSNRDYALMGQSFTGGPGVASSSVLEYNVEVAAAHKKVEQFYQNSPARGAFLDKKDK